MSCIMQQLYSWLYCVASFRKKIATQLNSTTVVATLQLPEKPRSYVTFGLQVPLSCIRSCNNATFHQCNRHFNFPAARRMYVRERLLGAAQFSNSSSVVKLQLFITTLQLESGLLYNLHKRAFKTLCILYIVKNIFSML